MPNFLPKIKKDITFKKFNHLTAIKFIEYRKSRGSFWLFECDCKNKTQKIMRMVDVVKGKIKSCGCIYHRLRNTRLYIIWKGMRDRCNNSNNKDYNNYGGRGIKISKEWNNFVNFYNWAINNGYKDNLSINRIENNKDYFPENCNWATMKE